MASANTLEPGSDTMTLRDLSLPVRLVLALFLLSVGYGYLSALVQLHFKEASPGEVLPTMQDVVRHYHGEKNKGQLERIITEPEHQPFASGGSMRSAFTFRASDWKRESRKIGEGRGLNTADAEKALRERRALEAAAVVAWIHADAPKEGYENFVIPAKSAKIFEDWMAAERKALKAGEEFATPKFIAYDEDKKEWSAEVKEILDTRCARCHFEGGAGAAGQIHLDSYEAVKDYIPPVNDLASRGISLGKLAQSTHVHLLGFSMLYGLTGLLFAFTSYPVLIRAVIAPLPLLAQIVDISFWWLARLDEPYGPMFAMAIPISGGIVGLGLMLQILLGVFALFHTMGRIVLVILIVLVAASGHLFVKPIVDAQLKYEKDSVMTAPAEVKEK